MAVYDVNGNIIALGGVINQNWTIGSDLIRMPISITPLGMTKYAQSFCMYNGHYFSTDGSHIAEESTDFTLIRDVSLNVGHGNAFQLGSGGHAYISGWDDQKVYDVDLETLTISEMITLPTTGYTTCAVDDIKKLIYIWQRDTNPGNSLEYYNFIVYDYDNEQVVSTAKTSKAFGAIQGVDMCMDLIAVIAGLGTQAIPNEIMIFDKSGNILSEYTIGEKATWEPEGVFIDRSTKEMYMSYYDLHGNRTGQIYKVKRT